MNDELEALIDALGGPTAAAVIADKSRQWLDTCRKRGALTNSESAARMLLAARWPLSRLAEVVLEPDSVADATAGTP